MTLLDQWQQDAVDKLVKARGGLCWAKVGEGKTRVGLMTFTSLQALYQNLWTVPSVCLVVCRRKAFYDWRNEIETCFGAGTWVYEDEVPEHPPGERPVFLLVSAAELCKREEILCANRAIRFVIVDESWMFANHKSARSESLWAITQSRFAVALSGTIMKARDTLEIWCQAKAVGKHRMLASSMTKFRSEFQICKPLEIPGRAPIPQFSPKPGSYAKILDQLSSCCVVHFPKGSRKIHEQYHDILATSQQKRMFKELQEFYSVEELDLEFDNALAISLKTQQIANGWIESGEGTIETIASNKPDKLSDELEDIVTSGERAVVWCAFRHDVALLADRCSFTSLQMLGGVDFDVDRWRNDRDVKVCFATEASGSSVNHFEQTPYAIYFSANFKWLDMQQSRGRTDRKSSRHTDCYYKYLQVKGSLDSHVYRTALASGARERDLIFNAGVKEWINKPTQ
jgi:hypothetical protein